MNNEIIEKKIRDVGKKLIESYISGETVEGGVNGPYDDPETKVRNLSHLAIICCIEVTKYGKNEYKPIVKKIGEELIEARGIDGLFVMRKKSSKDQCNGVIGHAWLNEALIYIYKTLGERKYLELAVLISKRHKFNNKIGLWERPTADSIDYTLNHQLWYAATLAELIEFVDNDTFDGQLKKFMKCLKRNFLINKDGRVRHSVFLHTKSKETIKQMVKNWLSDFHEKKNRPSMAYKENGYHVFNLMALARIYSKNKSYDFFSTKKFKASMDYVNNKLFLKGLDDSKVELDASLKNHIVDTNEKTKNIYGYPYNVPAFELLYINAVIPNIISLDVISECLNRQIEFTFDDGLLSFGKNCHDKKTINYRIYEYYRFLEIRE